MTTVSRFSTWCYSDVPHGNTSREVSSRDARCSRAAAYLPVSTRSKDSLKKPATILIGAAALVISLVPTGTFKLAEAAPLAAIASGGAIACLAADKYSTEH